MTVFTSELKARAEEKQGCVHTRLVDPDKLLRMYVERDDLARALEEATQELARVADIIEPHWRGAGQALMPSHWIVKEIASIGRAMDAAEAAQIAAEQSAAALRIRNEKLLAVCEAARKFQFAPGAEELRAALKALQSTGETGTGETT